MSRSRNSAPKKENEMKEYKSVERKNSTDLNSQHARFIDGNGPDATVLAEKVFSTYKTTFEALGKRISLAISPKQAVDPFPELIQRERLPTQNVNVVLTNKTPKEFASDVLNHPCQLDLRIEEIIADCQSKDFDVIAAPAVRGVIVGSIVAKELHKPFVPIRKAKIGESMEAMFACSYYYGDVALKVPKRIKPGQRIYLIDDDLLLGGTCYASKKVIMLAGAKVVGIGVLIEWPQLKGRKKLRGFEVFSSLKVFYIPVR